MPFLLQLAVVDSSKMCYLFSNISWQRHRPESFGNSATCDPTNSFPKLDRFVSLERLTGWTTKYLSKPSRVLRNESVSSKTEKS